MRQPRPLGGCPRNPFRQRCPRLFGFAQHRPRRRHLLQHRLGLRPCIQQRTVPRWLKQAESIMLSMNIREQQAHVGEQRRAHWPIIEKRPRPAAPLDHTAQHQRLGGIRL